MTVKSDVSGYVHGYTLTEQERLVSQSRFLAPWVFAKIDYSQTSHVLEVGCGVGAQLLLLLEKFPHLKVTGIDREGSQIAKAQELLAPYIKSGRATLVHGRGERLPFAVDSFDGGFMCWVLEHVADPSALLGEMGRVLAKGAVLYATEVYCESIVTWPRLPAIRDFWRAMGDYQAALGGDPNVGIRLPHLLAQAKLDEAQVYPLYLTAPADNRSVYFNYWQELMHSAAPGLVEAGRIKPALTAALDQDFAVLQAATDGALTAVAIQARIKIGCRS